MKRFLLLCAMCLLMLAACKRDPSAADVLDSAAENLASAESLQFTIERQGDPVAVELGGIEAGVAGANGSYRSPDQVHATVLAQVSGMITEAEVLWLPEGTYYKHAMLAPEFRPASLTGFDAPAMFSADEGIPQVLRSLENPGMAGVEDVDGVQAYHITAQAQGEDLTGLTGSVLASGEATLDVWVAQDSMQLIRLSVTESGGSGWLADFYSYGEPVDIPQP